MNHSKRIIFFISISLISFSCSKTKKILKHDVAGTYQWKSSISGYQDKYAGEGEDECHIFISKKKEFFLYKNNEKILTDKIEEILGDKNNYFIRLESHTEIHPHITENGMTTGVYPYNEAYEMSIVGGGSYFFTYHGYTNYYSKK